MVAVVLRVRVHRDSSPPLVRLLPALAFLLAVGVLRDALGTRGSGVSAFVLLPVLWVAVRGSRRELAIVVAAVAAVFVMPDLVAGRPEEVRSDWQVAGFVAGVAGIAGVLVQHLVGQVREQAHDAQQRQHEVEMLLELFRKISRAVDVRAAVCDAARVISRARTCLLVERDEEGRLGATAGAGARADGVDLRDAADEAVARVLRSGRGEVVSSADLDPALVAALGRSSWVALEPVVGPSVTGVLIIGLTNPTEHQPEALALLAADAETAIGRGDLVAQLESLARIDALTGLPNRRAWDEALGSAIAKAAREGLPLSVAVLDIDAFKAFNDSHGHQAGDRVLKEAAAAWRAELRDGDVLARWGGDEFALLLNKPRAGAQRVVERLRTSLVEQTSSAGLVEWDGVEDAHSVLARADAALYAAKAAHRAA